MEYFFHKYNYTWANERAIEIPLVSSFIKNVPKRNILEINNVFSTYKITKNLKMLLKGIAFIMLPRDIDYLLVKIFWSEKSIKPEELKHYSFTSLSLG